MPYFFSTYSLHPSLHFQELTLADLHLVSPITDDRLATTPPPPSHLYASIFASHCWVTQFGISLIPTIDVIVSLSCLLYAGRSFEAVLNAKEIIEATALPFWSWRVSQFRHSVLTTLTQIPFVNLGHRVRFLSLDLAQRLDSLSVGFPPQILLIFDAGHSTLLLLLKQGSFFEQHL